MGRRRRISVTARATKDRVMHYPSAFSEAFAEALLAAPDGEREGGGSGGERKDSEREEAPSAARAEEATSQVPRCRQRAMIKLAF